jgi:hypothetical protein
MKRKIFAFFVVLGLLTASFLSAEATSISGVSKYNATSQNMAGMEVTVMFGDGSSPPPYTWTNLPSHSSGVSDTGWSFTNNPYSATNDDTFWNNWTLDTTVGIKSITINGIIADVLFDIWGLGTENKGTPDSEYGKLTLPTDWSYSVSDPISLGGAAPINDLWGSITLTYIGSSTSGFTGTAQFKMDTDKTLVSETPEPATMVLLGAGLAGLGLYRRKRL